MNPWPACLNNLHGALAEFAEALSGKNHDLARDLISDISYAFHYIAEHAGPQASTDALVREAAAYTINRMAAGIPPDYVTEKPAG